MSQSRALPFAAFVFCVALFPLLFRSDFAIGAGITVAGFAVGTVGFVLLMGLAHQLAIGQAAFYMVGGYGSAILTTAYGWDGASAALFSAALAVALAAVIGWPLLKLRGFVLAIASLTLHLLFIALAILFVDFTGGAAGIPAVPKLSLGPWTINTDLGLYAVSWLVVLAMLVIGSNIDRSQIGRALRAVADDEAAAVASGIDTAHHKLLIFMVSAAMASLGGSLLVHYLRVIDPTVFGLQFSLDIITAVIVGGLHSVWGGVLGAAVIIAVRELLRLAEQPAWEVVVMGGLTVIVLLTFRAGLVGAIEKLVGWFAGPERPQPDSMSGRANPFVKTRDARNGRGPLLRVENVSRLFGSLRAVSTVSFEIERGTIVALIGPNGAGKTTMLDMISGHRALTDGTITYNGTAISALMPDEIARLGLARTFQAVRLFDTMSAFDNVVCGAHSHFRSTIAAVCLNTRGVRAEEQKLAATARAALDFVGLTLEPGRGPEQLPFGHRRMLELARALAMAPDLLLLDEPASGLNDSETEALADLLIRIRECGVTILLVEHDIRLVMGLADKIVVMDHGEKIADGAPDHVRADPQVISAYLGAAA